MSTLIQKLLKEGIIDKKEAIVFDAEVKNSGKKEEEIILEEGVVSEKFLFKLKSKELDIPFREEIDIESVGSVLPDILKLIPEDSAKYYKMVPMGKDEETIEIGMVYPEEPKAQEVLKFVSRRGGFSYKIFLITPSSFNKMLEQYNVLRKEMGTALGAIDQKDLEKEEELRKKSKKNVEEFQRMAEEAPIVRVMSVILRNAVEGEASDIHIEPGREKLKVRFRVDGMLYSSLFLPLKTHEAIVARVKILSKLKIEERRPPQDGRFVSKFGEKTIDFRVSTLPTTLGEKVVIRVLDPESKIDKVEDLGATGKNAETIKEATKKPTGMILATGPTGSGKTTTLYVLLNKLNKEEVNIVTLEDPVEYFIPGVNQSQTKPEIGYGFAQGLRQIVRQDPDIIMVGEIRDEETAELAIHAALTGHIVLSTLHTNDAVGVIPRLIDMGIQPFLLTPSLNMAIAQRLVRKLCEKCREEYDPPEEAKKMIESELKGVKEADTDSFKLYRPKGCNTCGSSGYKGRIGIYETLSMDDKLAEVVLSNASESKIKQQAKRQGMITMRQDGIMKAIKGETTIEEVIKVTKEAA